jgi:FkbM family methyltransferase
VIAAHLSQRIYPHEQAWQDDYAFHAPARTGSLLAGTTRDMHAHVFAIHGYYDWRFLATAALLCGAGDTLVEVGANVGTETIGLADIVGPRGLVYAFEPEPNNAAQLRRAMRDADLSQVEIIQAAVSDEAGTVHFAPSPNERESGSGRISSEGGGNLLAVECLTLDAYLSDKGPVRLVTIDAEGAEVRILRGGKEVLRRDRPAVIVEAQEVTLRQFGVGLADLRAELRAHDYHLYELSRFGLCDVDVEDTRRSRNWLALPPARASEAARIRRHLLRCGLLPCLPWLNPLTRRFKTEKATS